jgi:prepilin-type processing-associated H-X9-DG protein
MIGLILMAGLMLLGIILPAVQRARQEEEMRRCQNHLRQIGSFAIIHSTLPGEPVPQKANPFFPSATIPNEKLTFDQRLSWYVLILSALDQGPIEPGIPPQKKKATAFTDLIKEFDVRQPWNADVHLKIARMTLAQAHCPAQTLNTPGDQPALCNYLGNGGIGADAPQLPIDKAGKRAGVFRYDTPTPLEVLVNGDGASNTISFIETAMDLGPWIRGGPSTIRCLDPDQQPYLGAGRRYSGCHIRKGNFAFADGSVRVLTDTTNAEFFRSLLTIQGDDGLIDP